MGLMGKHGIGLYDGTSDNLVAENYIGNNGWSGVAIVGTGTTKNGLLTNRIGIGRMGEAVGNAFYGVDIIWSHDNTLSRNVITHNGTRSLCRCAHWRGHSSWQWIFHDSIYENSGAGIEPRTVHSMRSRASNQ